MNAKRTFYLLALMPVLFSACSTYNYAPLPQENPMFTQKGDLSVQGGMNLRFYQGQIAYAPFNGFGIMYGFSAVRNEMGAGYGHGFGLQHFGKFNRQGILYYSVGLGFGNGYLNNSIKKTGRGEFYYGEHVDRAISKYKSGTGSFGVYWKAWDEKAQLGFNLDITQANYSFMQFSRTEVDSNEFLGYSFIADNDGRVIKKIHSSVSFSIKATSANGLFYFKESIGFRTAKNWVHLYDKDPNSNYPTQNVQYRVPYIIFNFQIGMNIDRLYRK